MKVIVRLNGGMGNQMFQYAYASELAASLHSSLLIDRSLFNLPQTPEAFRLDEFALDLSFTSPVRNFAHRLILSPKIPKALGAMLCQIVGVEVISDHDTVQLLSNTILLNGYFQKPDFFSDRVNILRNNFDLKIADSQALHYYERINNSASVAVHVRRGDYASVAQFRDTLGVLAEDYYFNAISEMEKRTTAPRFFFFTNDPEWVKENLLPSTKNGELVELGADAKDTAEMALMRACRHFIVANSTFSWWPAFLGEAADKIVIAPNPWFRKVPGGGAELMRPEWVDAPAIWQD